MNLPSVTSIALISLSLSLILGCDRRSDLSSQQKQSEVLGEKVDVTVSLNSLAQLSLAGAASFEASLTGCLSGYRIASFNQDSTVSVYLGDTGCVIQLNSFTTSGGKSFGSPSGSSWATGAQQVFTEVSTGENAYLTVVAQLASPIGANPSVSFSYLELVRNEVTTSSNPSVSIEVASEKAPSFDLSQVSMVGFSQDESRNLYANFAFELKCNGTFENDACDGDAASDLNYVIVSRDFSQNPELSIEQAAVYFSDPSSVLSVSSYDLVNPPGFSLSARGPTVFADRKNMTLIIRARGSYVYFDITVNYL